MYPMHPDQKAESDRDGAFKIGISERNFGNGAKPPPGEESKWIIPGQGLQISHNVAYLEHGCLFKILGNPQKSLQGAVFRDNVFSAALTWQHAKRPFPGHLFRFEENSCYIPSSPSTLWKGVCVNGGNIHTESIGRYLNFPKYHPISWMDFLFLDGARKISHSQKLLKNIPTAAGPQQAGNLSSIEAHN